MGKSRPQILRFVISLLFALIVLGITLRAGWNAENSLQQTYRNTLLRRDFKALDEMVNVYRQKHHRPPQKISDLEEQDMYHALASFDEIMDTYWRKPIVYESDGSKHKFISHGRDGKPGGEGLDLDIMSDNLNPDVKFITFHQFLTYSKTKSVTQWGYFCGLMAFFLAFMVARPVTFKKENILSLLAGLFAIGFVLSLVTAFLTVFHVHAGHSGH